MVNYIIIILVYILFINLVSKKFKFLNHNLSNQDHKKINRSDLIHTGGIFFLPIIIGIIFYLDLDLNLNIFLLSIFLILIFIVGYLSDIKLNFNPILRLIIQIILFFSIIYFSDFFVNRSGITIIDTFLDNILFKYFFTVFCILVYINGLNFIDGINLNAVGYLLQLFLSLVIINENYINQIEILNFLQMLLVAIAVFYFFNFNFNNILGDSGIYLLGSIACFTTIYIVNNNYNISPLLAINLLWYPAFENLYSIIRKKNIKKNALKPDICHLHSLLYRYNKSILSNKSDTYVHNFSGITMNIFLIPNTLISIYFFNSSKILILNTLIYLILYLIVYYWLDKKIKTKKNS